MMMNTHYGFSCGACHIAHFKGLRHRCLRCAHYDLCAECYNKGVFTKGHLQEHPMQCILLNVEKLLFFAGEDPHSEHAHSYTCPYCGVMGFSGKTLMKHVLSKHLDLDPHVVCPICACGPKAGKYVYTRDFIGHLMTSHCCRRRDSEGHEEDGPPRFIAIGSRMRNSAEDQLPPLVPAFNSQGEPIYRPAPAPRSDDSPNQAVQHRSGRHGRQQRPKIRYTPFSQYYDFCLRAAEAVNAANRGDNAANRGDNAANRGNNAANRGDNAANRGDIDSRLVPHPPNLPQNGNFYDGAYDWVMHSVKAFQQIASMRNNMSEENNNNGDQDLQFNVVHFVDEDSYELNLTESNEPTATSSFLETTMDEAITKLVDSPYFLPKLFNKSDNNRTMEEIAADRANRSQFAQALLLSALKKEELNAEMFNTEDLIGCKYEEQDFITEKFSDESELMNQREEDTGAAAMPAIPVIDQ